ncbi:MAG: toxin-antitoxin system YwqK family antitoxin [Cyclobacteriaceae bacterium]|nr:toxin-antitoxin system YwqK family antitoxin [Cyclobacteriaceae bacterium]
MNRQSGLLVAAGLVLFGSFGCSSGGKKKDDKPKDNIVRTYDREKRLKSEVPMKDGKRHGLARMYYPSGKVNLELPYVEDQREGTSKKYYESGLLFQETDYHDDQVHGIQKKYDVTGLISESRFEFGMPCMGLKEYAGGKERSSYPSIVIRPVDRLQVDGTYTLELSLTEGGSKATFYLGQLTSSGCLHSGLVRLPKGRSATSAYQQFALHPGQFIMEELNIIADVTTRKGNNYITQRKFPLAIEN